MAGAELNEQDYGDLRHRMVETQLRDRGIADPVVLRAMREVPRHRFVDPDLRAEAYEDRPLPIGLGQTISQPYVVARMTELLKLDRDARVLEVGTGSGYQAAVLGAVAHEVWSIERHADLASLARERLEALGYTNVHVIQGDGTLGLEEQGPFQGILVTAAGPGVPESLSRQLAEGARLVIPVGDGYTQVLRVVTRQGDRLREQDVLGVRFVPLVGREGYPPERGGP